MINIKVYTLNLYLCLKQMTIYRTGTLQTTENVKLTNGRTTVEDGKYQTIVNNSYESLGFKMEPCNRDKVQVFQINLQEVYKHIHFYYNTRQI